MGTINEIMKKGLEEAKPVAMWNPKTQRKIDVRTDQLQLMIREGCVPYGEHELKEKQNTEHFVIHPKYSDLGVQKTNGIYLPGMIANGYVECDANGNVFEKPVENAGNDKIEEEIEKPEIHKKKRQ